MKLNALCHRLDEEIVAVWECRMKYRQLFYILLPSVISYLKFHSNSHNLWKLYAFNNDSHIIFTKHLEEEQKQSVREVVWINEFVSERLSICTYIAREHKTSEVLWDPRCCPIVLLIDLGRRQVTTSGNEATKPV
jgi:hypothetical protein